MAQLIRCPLCDKPMQVPESFAGKQVRCPHKECGEVFVVPTATVRELAGVVATGKANVPAAPRRAPPAASPAGRAAEIEGGQASDETALLNFPECPACKAVLLPGAIACMDCGYLLQPDAGAEPEGPPNLCTNPACGVVNAANDRHCQRCGSPLPTPPGTVLHGRYRIERQLAVGGFGAVYLATDTKEGNRAVAIKDMICADPQEFSIRLNFFRREAEILRSLESLPIVPRVHDFIQQGQTAHLVLEFIRGRDLLQIMESNGAKPFPIARVVEWAKEICDVLMHMHGQSPPLVHRDLKPDNIMLMEDQRHIKFIDFGTARDIGRTNKSRLAAKTRVFTEGYAPPEQIIGKPEPRSDLFALAGTLFHLVTGRVPEGTRTAKELAGHLADPSCTLPADYRWFFELLQINLAEDINARYFSVRDFKADLERGQVTREVQCPKCRTINRVREPYCAKCAEPLTEPTPPCTFCGKLNRMGSRCCIHCGHRLR
jgi:predicted Ser/Thr protein kinase